MAQEFSRALRVGEQIRRELAEQIRKLKDPRVGMVTITDVEVTKDLSVAKVFYSVLGEDDVVTQTQKGLERAAGFIRRELGHAMRLRVVPELRFHYDDTELKGNRIDRLIDEALNRDRMTHSDEPQDES
jgi:ribosome-binding factor A